MWDIIYPDIELDKQEREDTGVKLLYLVRIVYVIIAIKAYGSTF